MPSDSRITSYNVCYTKLLRPLTFRHRAGVTPYTSPYGFAECCVFGKQSPPPGRCNPHQLIPLWSPAGAHLLPKLRCQFAEFLRLGSLKRLGILSPPTCVGLRYGPIFRSTVITSYSIHYTKLYEALERTRVKELCKLTP